MMRRLSFLPSIAFGLVAACSATTNDEGDDARDTKEERVCRAMCTNEAQLSCPNGDEARCVTECRQAYEEAQDSNPGCVHEIDAVFACTAMAPVTSIECDPDSSMPTYADGVCIDEEVLLKTCAALPPPAEACNSIANEGPTVPVTMVAEDPPTADAIGGEVVPGTYRLTSKLVFTGPEGSSGATGRLQRQTLLVSIDAPGTLRIESALSLDGGSDRRTSMTTTLSGSTATVTQTCPENVTLGGFYTATATSYVTYDSIGTVATYELDSSE